MTPNNQFFQTIIATRFPKLNSRENPLMPKQFLFHYIVNGKPETRKEPVYFYEWTLDGGCTKFGMHGTQAEWKVKLKELKEKHYVLLLLQKFVCPLNYEEKE